MPLGRSTATTGAGWAFIASITAARRPLDRPIETGAEQRVDDDLRRPRSRCGSAGATGPFHFAAATRGIAFQPAHVAHQQHLDPIAALGEEPRGDKAIAAVVAGPGHHDDPAAGRMASDDGGGDRGSGALHQVDAGHATRNRQAVGFGHFGGGEELKHGGTKITKRARCTPTGNGDHNV